jgi:uncharacterized protein (TIGR02284 family)
LRPLIHGYGEDLNVQVPSYRLEEIITEKMRSLLQTHKKLVVRGWNRPRARDHGGEPEDDQSTMGAMHQRWLDLKAAITGRDDKAIINEVERGEDYLKKKFETALNSGHLSGDARSAVESAFQSVRKGHDQMSSIKHGLEA